MYPEGNTDTAFVTSIYTNLFNRAPDAEGLSYWVAKLTANGTTPAEMTRDVMIEAMKNGATGTDATIIANKATVGLYVSDTLGLNLTDFSLASVTEDAATVTTVKADADTYTPKAMSLTTGADTGAAFTGGNGDDTFTASVLTANDGDILAGGNGADTLNVETAANLTENFKTSSIETVNLNALGAVTVDTKNMTGITTFNSNDAAGAVVVNNIADATMAFGIKGAAVNNIDLNYATGKLNGAADKLMVTLNGATGTIITADTGFESVELKTTAASTLTTLTASGATALTLSGNATLTVGNGVIDSFTAYTVSDTAKVTFGTVGTVKTFDASANTGGIVGKTLQTTAGLDFGHTTDEFTMHSAGGLVQTGSGDDNIALNTASVFSTNSTIVKLGAGSDKLSLEAVSASGEYIYGEDGDDTVYVGAALTSSDLIDGGAGTDTVNFAAASHSLIAKGIEKVGVNGATTVNFVTVDSAVDITDAGAAAVTFANLKAASTYTSSLAKTGLTTLGFAASQAATINANFTKGTTGGLTTTNAANVTATYGAASDVAAAWTLDGAATSLTINATGALSATAAGQDIATSSTEKLQTVTVTGDKAIKLGDITNNDALTAVSVSSTGGAVIIDDIAGGTVDYAITKIEVKSDKAGASFGATGSTDFTGAAGTVASNVAEITATATGTVATDHAAIGAIAADKIGTITSTATKGNATIGGLTVGADTTDTTDGTITAIKASGALIASVAAVAADSIGSIIAESTDTVTGGAASVAAVTGNTATKLVTGDITVTSAKSTADFTSVNGTTIGNIVVTATAGAAGGTAPTAITAVKTVGNVTVTGGTTAAIGAIAVGQVAVDTTSVLGNVTLTAGTGPATTSTIAAETMGDVTVKSTSAGIVAGAITAADTGGLSVSLNAGTTIAGAADNTLIKNTKGDLSVTLKAGGLISAAAATMKFEAGTSASADIDIVVDASTVVGAVAATGDDMVVTNGATDSASSTIVKGGAAANFVTIATDAAATGTVTYYGQTDVDTITVTGKAAATIYAEAGADVIVGGAGVDTIYGAAGADTITAGLGADILYLGDADAAIDNVVITGGLTSDTVYNFTTGAGGDKVQVDISEVETAGALVAAVTVNLQYLNADTDTTAAAVTIQEVVDQTGGAAVAAAAGATLFVLIGETYANVAAVETGLETGDHELTVAAGVAANDAFLVLWSDGTDVHLSSMYVATDNDVWVGGELVGTDLAVIKAAGTITASEFNADNFAFIA